MGGGVVSTTPVSLVRALPHTSNVTPDFKGRLQGTRRAGLRARAIARQSNARAMARQSNRRWQKAPLGRAGCDQGVEGAP
jgi:hypothetical protein